MIELCDFLLLSYFSFSLYFLAILLYFFFTSSLLLRSIDRLRYDTPAPCVILLIIGFLSQLLDDRVEVRDDVEKRRPFFIDRVPHVSHQRHKFFRH